MGTAALGAVAFFSLTPISKSIAAALVGSSRPLLGFKTEAASTADIVVVPEGY